MKALIIILILSIFFNNLSAKEKKFQLTKVTYDGITKVQKLLDENKNNEAKLVLLELKDSGDIRKKLDKAYVRFYLGYFFTTIDDSKQAIKYFKEAVSYKSLAPTQVLNSYLNLVQLSMELENYQDSIIYVDKLIAISKPVKAEYIVIKANIEMILKDYKKVIRDINKAIEIETKPKVPWLKMQYYSFYMLKEYKNTIDVLKQLIELEPKNKGYWLQLSSLYSVVEDSDKSLSSLDIARIADLDLNEKEVLRLVSWLQYSNVPYKAAVIMEKNVNLKVINVNEKNLNGLGDLYYEAKDYKKAIYWYKKSAKIAKSSKIYFKIAKIYANERNYEEVISNLKLSLETKNTKKDGSKYLLLGKAYYETKNLIEAKKSFYKAKEYNKSKKMAAAWLDYI